jgi:hypothetical protein
VAPNATLGAICIPSIRFRRFEITGISPASLNWKQIFMTDLSNRDDPRRFPFRTAQIDFLKPPVDGWMATLPTGREYWMHVNVSQRIDPTAYTLLRMEPLEAMDFMFISTKSTRVRAL